MLKEKLLMPSKRFQKKTVSLHILNDHKIVSTLSCQFCLYLFCLLQYFQLIEAREMKIKKRLEIKFT